MKIKIGNKYYSLTSKEANIKGVIMVIIATIITLILVFIRQELQQMILYLSGAMFLALKIMWIADKLTNWYIKKYKNPDKNKVGVWDVNQKKVIWQDPDDLDIHK